MVITPFQVIQSQRLWYESKAYIHDFLLVINTNLPPIFGLHFTQNVSVYLQPLYVIGPKSYRIRLNNTNYAAITPFKVIQGHRCWYQLKAHMRLASE